VDDSVANYNHGGFLVSGSTIELIAIACGVVFTTLAILLIRGGAIETFTDSLTGGVSEMPSGCGGCFAILFLLLGMLGIGIAILLPLGVIHH
jgi:hypothetical protein